MRPAGASSFADLGWWNVFQDPQLTAYIGEALTNNWDIKIAAARVLQAEGALRVARSQFFPTVSAGGDLVASRSSQRGPVPLPPGLNPERNYGDVFGAMSTYEVDLWGKIRRANEAARAQLVATQDAQQTVRQTLVADRWLRPTSTCWRWTMTLKLPGAPWRCAPTRWSSPTRASKAAWRPCRM